MSLFTVLALCVTIVLHCCFGLNPRFNLFLNSVLLVPWTVGFALLSWWSSGTLTHVCNVDNWHDDVGIMVCRIYKALFAFALLGFVSTVGALALDIIVYRRHTRLGVYNPMQDIPENKRRISTYDPRTSSPFGSRALDTDGAGHHGAYSDRDYATSAADLGNHATATAVKEAPQRPDGYAVPEGQFGYDTSYRGVHGVKGDSDRI